MKQIVKKVSVVGLALGMLFVAGLGGLIPVQAQTVTPTPTPTPSPTVTPVSTATAASVPLPTVTPLSAIATPSPTPSAPIPTAGYLQFNNLSVTSVSGTAAPATIYAAPPTQTVTGIMSDECTSYVSESDTVGSPVPCPLPPGGATSTYIVDIADTTQLLLSDRTSAVLGNITPGDIVNVYGYYSGNGVIQAQVVRDLSKPIAPGTVTAPVPAATTPAGGNTSPLTTPAAPVVGTNPTEGQLLQILQTLMIQMQGILAQLVQMSGAPIPTGTGTGTSSGATTTTGLAPMIPAPTPSPSATPSLTPAPTPAATVIP